MKRNSIVRYLRTVISASIFLSTGLLGRQMEVAGSDTIKSGQSRVYPLPILFYTPETGIAGGAAALYIMRDSASSRPSSITSDIIYTERKQVIVELDDDLYFQGDDYRLLSSILFQRFPNKFFGIGNSTASDNEETFTPQYFIVRAVLYRKILSNFHIAPLIRYESVSMKEVDPAGMLAPGTITGSKGGTSAGLGVVANWDSRDNTFAASSGGFYQVTGLFYKRAFGGDFNFSDILLDTRNYVEITPAHVFAFQAAAEFMNGNVPFQDLVRFGGQNIIRGYFDGRYRDKNGIAFQGEYRFPVWWRFGLIAFAGAAQVANSVGDLAMNRFWFAGGGGLRFSWNPKEHIVIRLDYGVGNNSSGVYVTVTEAF